MKNINKNAVQAISLDGKAYLAHKSVENFSMGAGDFTIEVLFICNSITDCCFYAQEQGFEFGIKDGGLYFELEGVGSIKQNEGILLETDALYFAAVSCVGGALSLYFEGFPVADVAETKPTDIENGENYLIGKGLDGYIVEVRLRSCGMTDQEILHDCGMGLRDCDSVEFWSDFTTIQYKDKSSNALSLWTNGGIIVSVNTCSCTQLSSNGGFATVIKQSYTSGYTLLFKIFPRLENNNIMYIYSVSSSEGQTVFSVGLQSDDGGYKHIFVEHNGASYLGKSALPLAQWVDVALRIESGEAKVYIDGTDEMSFSFSGELNNVTAMIGVKPFTKKISFKNSFDGYLDYFAEFECALEPDKINFYAEEQPYIFDDSIRTLYAFYCGEPTDLVSGGVMYKVGQSKPIFEKNLNSMTAPVGMDLRVPQEVCAEWQELSEYEQWATAAAMDMVRETYSQSMGLAMPEGMIPIEQTATKQIRQLFEEEIHEVKTVWTPENESIKANSVIKGGLSKAVGGLGFAVAGGNLAGTAVRIATATSVGENVILVISGIMVTTGIMHSLEESIWKMESASKKKMPNNKCGQLQLISICCNHNGDPKTGSIHFHSDELLTEPDSMTYMVEDDFAIDLLLITSELGNVKMQCLINNTSEVAVSGVFGVSCQDLILVDRAYINVPPRRSLLISLELTLRNKICQELAEYRADEWEFFFNDEALCICHANIYLLENLPIAPWETHIGEEYFGACIKYPALYFINTLIIEPLLPLDGDFGAETKDVMLRDRVKDQFIELLNLIYDSGRFKYNYRTNYVYDFVTLDLRKFLTDIYDNDNHIEVNCTDCANIVSLIGAILGIRLRMNLILGRNKNNEGNPINGFRCNQIIPMQHAGWENVDFIYHQVAFYSEIEGFDRNSEIYDLSLKIDSGPHPNAPFNPADPAIKVAFLSGGYEAYEQGSVRIHTLEPYEDRIYLGRLVQTEQIAAFLTGYLNTDIRVNGNVGGSQNKPYLDLKQQYIQFYELGSEKYAVEIPQQEVKLPLLQEMGLEKMSEDQYECEWFAPDDIGVTWFRNAEHLPAGEYLASILIRYSCRLTEKEAPELGERVFYGPDLLITYFEGSAYSINCKDMEKAEEIAHRLKSSVMQ